MTKYTEILRLHSQGVSGRGIASSCSCSRNTVSNVLERAKHHEIHWPFEKDLTDQDLENLLFPEKKLKSSRKMPDSEYIHKELAKSGVTLSLLWNEYCEKTRLSGEIPLMYSQFCRYYREYAHKTKATMRIKRKPGELMEVDWAGDPAYLKDYLTGEAIPVPVFVAVLACSQYAYVEACGDMKMESWIDAHVNAFNYFGGVTRILVPDNLKTGVDKSHRTELKINRTYHELAEHYGTAVIPARVKKPRDKPLAEGTVGIISTWIVASLRHQQFFSLQELNEAIRKKLAEFNEKSFQKKPGSRMSAFHQEEKAHLLPLPTSPYELATWSDELVQVNYHINVDKNHYSVPYEYIRQRVNVRLTSRMVEIFYHHHRIASHRRLRGMEGEWVTLSEHMPENHRHYLSQNSDYFRKWATDVGPSTAIVVEGLLGNHKVEKQGYRACTSLMKLGDKYSLVRLEHACQRGLGYTPSPSVKSIQTILTTGQDKVPSDKPPRPMSSQGFVRGAAYFGGDDQ